MDSHRDLIVAELGGIGSATAVSGGGYAFDPDTIRRVSDSFATKANTPGASYVAYGQRNMAICPREAQRCQDALDTYLGVEDRTVIDIGSTPAL
ncbi:hypothetical protein [Actinophytocola sp.]|uniref:hypothetical protein n=1 Tax=Actinophytocola sp. TaxID=1872138 RepID=UPI002D6FC2B5|nr:hypothetical protein [Actinophytocola sp.]HYQ67196.1 hypothetical protein [Actinophytocola sp.]